ncbi:MAG: NAD-dependent deacylase [Pseudomonadota bacterium]
MNTSPKGRRRSVSTREDLDAGEAGSAPKQDEAVQAAAELLGRTQRAYALTGAGISAASGIPDFRGASGLWQRFPPAEFSTIDAFVSDPDKVWRMLREVGAICQAATPNAGHRALVALQKRRLLRGVITQNIDGLHQAAGSRSVVEYHGSSRRLHCLGCGAEFALWRRARAIARGQTPRCSCGNALKPTVVLFGEMLPPQALRQAEQWMEDAEVLLVVGTSANVAPASELPLLAKAAGALVIEFNLEATALTEVVTDIFVQGPSEQSLPLLVAALSRPGWRAGR